MFGHPVTLNFNKKGSEHLTYIGAFFSVIMKLFLLLWIVDGTLAVINKTRNSLNTDTLVSDFGEIGEV